jgi:hypothetical protein
MLGTGAGGSFNATTISMVVSISTGLIEQLGGLNRSADPHAL